MPTATPDPSVLKRDARRLANEAAAYYAAGHYKAAIRTYLQAIAAQGHPNAGLEHDIALAYTSDRNYDQAIVHYRKSLAIENDSGTRTNLAWVYYRSDLCPAAIQEALRALRLADEPYSDGTRAHASANQVAARCYEEQGNLTQALEHVAEALTLAQLHQHPADDIDELAAKLNKLTALTRQPDPTPNYGAAPTAMLTWTSEQDAFWIPYPGGCHHLELQEDGWWVNDQRCTLDTLIGIAIREWPPSQNLVSLDIDEWVDGIAEDWGDNPGYRDLYRDRVHTQQGRTLELIRWKFDYRDGTPGTSVAGFYIHPNTGALFRVRLHYAAENWERNRPIVDFVLNNFTVLR